MSDEIESGSERKKDGLDIIVLKPMSPVLAEIVKERLEPDHNLLFTASPAEAVQLTYEFEKCIVYACIVNRKTVEPVCNMLMKLKLKIKMRQVKVVVMTKVINAQLRTLFNKLSITDFIEEPINSRALYFKVNMQLKALKTQIDKDRKAAEEAKKAMLVNASGGVKKKDDDSDTTISFKRKPAVEVGNDAFVFSGKPVEKKDNKYTVVFDGPTPLEGEWTKDEKSEKTGSQPAWKWNPKEGSPGATKPGEEKEDVIFEGDKPVFNQATGQWQLKGEKPELSLQLKGKKVARKVATNENGEIEVAEEKPEAIEAALALKKKFLAGRQKSDINNRIGTGAGEEVGSEEDDDNLGLKKVEADSPDSQVKLQLKTGVAKAKKSLGESNSIPSTDEEEEDVSKLALKKGGSPEKQAKVNVKISPDARGDSEKEDEEEAQGGAAEEAGTDATAKLQLKKGVVKNTRSKQDGSVPAPDQEETTNSDASLALREGNRASSEREKPAALSEAEATGTGMGVSGNKGADAKGKGGLLNNSSENEGAEDSAEKLNLKKGSAPLRPRKPMAVSPEEEVKEDDTAEIKTKKLSATAKKKIEKLKKLRQELEENKIEDPAELSAEEAEEVEAKLNLKKGQFSRKELAKKKRDKIAEEIKEEAAELVGELEKLPASVEGKSLELDKKALEDERSKWNLHDGEGQERSKLTAHDWQEDAPVGKDDKVLEALKVAEQRRKEAKEKGLIEDESVALDLKGKKGQKSGENVAGDGKNAGGPGTKDGKFKDESPEMIGDRRLEADEAPTMIGDRVKKPQAAKTKEEDDKPKPVSEVDSARVEEFLAKRKKQKELSGYVQEENIYEKKHSQTDGDSNSENSSPGLEKNAKSGSQEASPLEETKDSVEEQGAAAQKTIAEQEEQRSALNARLASKLKGVSPELASFLENRKKVVPTQIPDAQIIKRVEARFESATNPESALLAFKMILSDVVHSTRVEKDPRTNVKKVLQQAVVGIGFCAFSLVRFTQKGQGLVYECSDTIHKVDQELTDLTNREDMLCGEIRQVNSQETMAYLIAVCLHKREKFSSDDQKVFSQILELFTPYWQNVSVSSKGQELKRVG